MLAMVWIRMQICLTCERPLIVATAVLCIQIRRWEMTQALRDTNKPHTHTLQNVTIYLYASFACTWWKAKSNITCARRYGQTRPMRLDIPRATILQWSNKEWLGRVLLSWINIRGQTDLVNTHTHTQLLTFIEMHWMVVVCIKLRILRWDLAYSVTLLGEKEIVPHHGKSQTLL